MPLSAGARVGPYQILSALGAGGMGEVYRARDARLNRDVAIKILPEAFAADADRVARFQREARVLASLNHPHIAAIYGFESADSVTALVMELVEGEDLAQRLARGPIPFEDALPLAKQIAEALEAAHEQGIVHRDLKPANIKLRPDGTVKVLDFGLAKPSSPVALSDVDPATSPTITSPAMTQLGMILGTAAYMSPEQAKGREADKRSDVWAFGAVLYEMLSGERAFKGHDAPDTLAAVLRQDLDWTALPESTGPSVRRLIGRCLERDVKRRLRDIGEARIVLEDPAAIPARDTGVSAAPALPPQARPGWRTWLPLVLSAAIGSMAAGLAAWHFKPSTPLTVARLEYTLPEEQSLTGVARRVLDISRDGTRIVYVANGRLYLRLMSEPEAKPIRGTEVFQAIANPVFSPDGRSIAFHAASDQTLKRIAAEGGAAVTLCTADMPPFGMSWGPDGILFADAATGIRRVSPNGSTPDLLVSPKDGEIFANPQLLPGGQQLLFTVATGFAANRWDSARIVAQSLTTGKRTTIVTGGSDGRYVHTGHLLYDVSGSVMVVPFNVQRLAASGTPATVMTGVLRSATSGAADFGISENGTLIYVPGTSTAGQSEMVMANRRQATDVLALPPALYMVPRVAPNGARVAFMIDDGKQANVYTYELSGASGMQRLTFEGNNRFPTWASNTRVAFQSDREGDLAIFWQSAAGGPAERLTRPARGTAHVPESWSANGDTLLFSVIKGSEQSLWTLSIHDRTVRPFGGVVSSSPPGAVFSPDGRWVAYTRTERNRTMIYVQPFPPSGSYYELPAAPSDIASQPLWSPDGKELFYNPGPGRLAWVGVTTHPAFAFTNPQSGPRPFQTGPPSMRRAFDITPGGKFVGLAQEGQTRTGRTTVTQIDVILNWFEELKALGARAN